MRDITGVILFQGVFNLFDEFSDELRKAAEQRGLHILILNRNDNWSELSHRIEAFHDQDPNCLAILFNNIVLPLEHDSRNIWDDLEIPVFDLLVDHPIHYAEYLRNPINQLQVGVVDRHHLDFIHRHYPQVQQVCFLPHGGIETPGWKPYDEREIDVLYAGMCQEEHEYGALPFLPDQGVAFYGRVMEIMLHEPSLTTEAVVLRTIQELDLSPTPEQEFRMINNAVITSEWNMRRVYKLEIIRQLGAAGIHVDVIGDHYEDPDIDWPDNVSFHPPVTMEGCRQAIGNARICLNIMPWFKDGSHDRVFNAMLNGAVCVTDITGYLQERFTHGQDIVFYDLGDIPQLVANVRWLLNNPNSAARIAQRGHISASVHDTWANRLDQILAINQYRGARE